jgi:3-methyladenine DNA glycosylase AlkD
MSVTTLQTQIDGIRRALEQVADAERKAWAEGYHPTSREVIGVKIPDLRRISKDLDKRFKKSAPEDVIEFAKALVTSNIFEHQLIAYEIVSRHKGAMLALQERDLKVLGQDLDNWLAVDTFAALVAGPLWRNGQLPDVTIQKWAQSKDRWWRRAAVVCTVALNQKARGGTGDALRTLDICRLVASDQDEMVAKGLSWALRELAKRDTKPVRAFITEYEEVLSARVKREVQRKVTTGRK